MDQGRNLVLVGTLAKKSVETGLCPGCWSHSCPRATNMRAVATMRHPRSSQAVMPLATQPLPDSHRPWEWLGTYTLPQNIISWVSCNSIYCIIAKLNVLIQQLNTMFHTKRQISQRTVWLQRFSMKLVFLNRRLWHFETYPWSYGMKCYITKVGMVVVLRQGLPI